MTEPSHPDDEQLSALLDGEAAPEVAAHVEGCHPCRARVGRLGAVARAVAGPVRPPSPAFLDGAVAAAVAQASPAQAAPAPVAAAGAGLGPPTPLVPRTAGPRPALAWLAAAAAAVAGVVGVSVLVQNSSGGSDQTALDRTAGQVAGPGASTDDGAGQEPAAVDGDLSSPSPAPTTSSAAAARTAPQAAVPPAEAETPVAGGDLGQQADTAAVAGAVSAALDPGVTEAASGAPRTAAAVAPACVEQARAAGGDRLGPLVYVATARWGGVPATVAAFSLRNPTGGFERQLYVMSQSSCAVLAERRF